MRHTTCNLLACYSDHEYIECTFMCQLITVLVIMLSVQGNNQSQSKTNSKPDTVIVYPQSNRGQQRKCWPNTTLLPPCSLSGGLGICICLSRLESGFRDCRIPQLMTRVVSCMPQELLQCDLTATVGGPIVENEHPRRWRGLAEGYPR